MSQADKTKLAAWKELLHQTGTIMTPAQCTPEVAALLGATQDNVSASGSSSADVLTRKISDSLDGADVYSSIAVLTAVCNANPVIFLKYPQNFTFSGLGLMVDSEALAGRIGNATTDGPCLPGAIDMLLRIDSYYASKFAKLVSMLHDISEGDGTTALDNTAAVWFQEMSDGSAQNLNNIPIVQAGSAGGYFKTGWVVNVEDGSPNLSNGNSESACTDGTSNMISGSSQSTGTDPKLANAPINKYYCGLMNALGVKAGTDGFPAKDGPAEVSRFGMYDRTEDFIGGGSTPATIHDPGEFDALKV